MNLNYLEIIRNKRKIEIWDNIWPDDIIKFKKKLMKYVNESEDPIFMHISGFNDAKSETMVLFDIISLIRAPKYSIAAGGLEGLNGLLFLCGDKRIAYPNMWLKLWWPIVKQDIDLEDIEIFKSPEYVKDLSKLDTHIIRHFCRLLDISFEQYKQYATSEDEFMLSDLLERDMIDYVLDQRSNDLIEMFK